MEGNPARKLNFNAPLLSTRRPGSYLEEQATSCSASHHRVPFSWEQAPGKPKASGTSSDEAVAFTPRPKPPPGRWRRPPTNHEDEDESGKDILSLTEAIDIVEKLEEQVEGSSDTASSNLDRLTLQSVGELNGDGATPSPNFMMERFLPDAAALAAATSALNLSKGLNQSPQTRSVAESISSTKACGLEMMLPWRMRQRLAGVKSLVHHPRSNAKHKRRLSSLHLPSADWSCKY